MSTTCMLDDHQRRACFVRARHRGQRCIIEGRSGEVLDRLGECLGGHFDVSTAPSSSSRLATRHEPPTRVNGCERRKSRRRILDVRAADLQEEWRNNAFPFRQLRQDGGTSEHRASGSEQIEHSAMREQQRNCRRLMRGRPMSTQYYTASSIDGFIADSDNSLSALPVQRAEWDGG